MLQNRGWRLLLAVLEAQIPQLDSQGFGNVLLALGRLEQAPEPLLAKLLPAAQAALPTFLPQHVSNSLLGLAYLSIDPGHAFLVAAAKRFVSVIDSATPQNIANALWAYATLGVEPGRQLLDAYVERLLAVLSDAELQPVANSLWAIGQLGHDPGPAFMAEALQYCMTNLQVSSVGMAFRS